MRVRCFGVLLLIHTALANVTTTINTNSTSSATSTTNATKDEVINVTKAVPISEVKVTKLKISRRKNKKSRSTSSSSGEKAIVKDRGSEDKSSLEIQSSQASTMEEKNETTYGTGWRRWHRKCTPCPVEMGKRWREPTIQWICGGFQRARRSFKSLCMMHFRNCQDGTMFVKIHSQRCSDTQPGNYERGRHWFYDYKVALTDDSTDSDTDTDSSDVRSSGDSDSIDSLSLGK